MPSPRRGRTVLVGVAAAAIALVGCGPADEVPGDEPAEGDVPAGQRTPPDTGTAVDGPPAAASAPTVAVQPIDGSAGDSLLVEATGCPPGTEVEIGLGPPRSEYEVVASDSTTADGTLVHRLAVPDWIEAGRPLVAVVVTRDHAVRAVSGPIPTEGPAVEGELTVTGEITGEGPECPALRTDDGEVYALTGAPDGLAAGDRVTVVGRPVEMSFCMRGTTLEVRSLTRNGS